MDELEKRIENCYGLDPNKVYIIELSPQVRPEEMENLFKALQTKIPHVVFVLKDRISILPDGQEVKALLDQQKQELLDALTIEKKPYSEDFKCGGCGECEACLLQDDKKTKSWNAASDELEAKKRKIREGM